MRTWTEDFKWQASYAAAIRQIVGPHLLRDAPLALDQSEATDLLILTARDMRIACRVRKPGYAHKYPFEFTIRSRRESGAETEWRKIADGFGDWLFYGHATETGFAIERWMIVDLHAWRAQHIRWPKAMAKIAQQKSNFDGTHFVAYDMRQFMPQPPILIAQSFTPEMEGELL